MTITTINSVPVMELYPYNLYGTWVFDDASTGLKEEAFVLGMTEMISRMVSEAGVLNPYKGFRLMFSFMSFEGSQACVSKIDGGDKENGNWYEGDIYGQHMKGWLCPALYLYFPDAPQKIHIRVENLPEGVNPIWNTEGQQHKAFVSVSELYPKKPLA